MKYIIRFFSTLLLTSFFSSCFIWNAIGSFDARASYVKEKELLTKGKIAAVFDNQLAHTSYFDEQLLVTALDEELSDEFEEGYISVLESRKIIRNKNLVKILESIHPHDEILLVAMSSKINKIKHALGARYLVYVQANEITTKFKYDWGSFFPNGYAIGTNGGYGRNMMIVASLVDLETKEVLLNEYSLEMLPVLQTPDYDSFVGNFSSSITSYLGGRIQ